MGRGRGLLGEELGWRRHNNIPFVSAGPLSPSSGVTFNGAEIH